MPEPNPSRKSWLLDNGKAIDQPELEISGSGRRVRIKDRQETSVYTKDRDAIIQEAIEAVASRENTNILTCVRPNQARQPLSPIELKPEKGVGRLVLKWRYEHASMPLFATVQIILEKTYRGYQVNTSFVATDISASSRHAPKSITITDQEWAFNYEGDRWGSERQQLASCLENPGFQTHFTRSIYKNEREAMRSLRDHIDRFDAWATVEIPDYRNPVDIKWLSLDLHDTNVDGSVMRQVADYLDSEPIANQVKAKYDELRQLLKILGLNLGEMAEDDFMRAASTGSDEALAIRIDGTDNTAHTVHLHLATGTLHVACGAMHRENGEQWELARFEAEMKGELDAFLNFYRTMSDSRHQVIDLINARRA